MSKIVCRKACFFTFWIVCWVTSPLPLGRAEAKATDMVGFFYVPIIYRFRALIILLLSGRYCRAKILRSAWGGEPAQMVRSAPRNEPWAPHHQPARTALAPPPAPPARGGEAAAGIWGGGREAAAVAPPPPPRPAAHGASLLPGFLSQPSGGSLPSPAAAGCANCVRAAARVRQVRQRGDRRLELGRLRRLRSAGLRTPRALRGSGDAGARLSSRPSRAGLCGCSVRSWRRGRRRRAAEDGARLRKRRARGGGMSVLF